MNKKGFTLVELLAIIIVLGVITSITISVITMNIENTRENSFEVSAKNLLDASKEYVTKNMENHDFPKEGISANLKELGIENNPYISGIIKRDENGQIVLIDVTDGTYCANGTKTNLTITKDDCSKDDETKAELKVKVLDVKTTEAKIMIKTFDGASGIDKYKYCLIDGENKECKEIEKNGERNLVKEIIKLENLKVKTKYRLEIEVINGSSNEAIKTSKEIVEFETKEIEEPKFKLSSNTYATEKELIITYPNVGEGYEYKYKKITDKEEIIEIVNGTEAKIKITSGMKINAYIEKDNKLIVENSIIIEGIDLEPPIVNVMIPNIDEWTTSKTITISAIDKGVGVALRPYSYDNGRNWQKNNELVFKSAIILKAKSRDRLGNINSKFTVNNGNEEYEDFPILKIDSEGPKIIYEVIEGSKESKDNEWYSSNKVVLKVTVIDENKLIKEDGSIVYTEDGVGVDPNKIEIISDNKNAVIEKMTDTEYKIIMTANGIYNIKSTAKDLLGNQKEKYYFYTIKKDDIQPTISAKNISNVYYGASENVTNYFNISKYGVAGGKTTCYYKGNAITNNNQLERGVNTVTCKMVGTNGKKAEANVVVKHKYNAKVNCSGGRSVNGENCTYYYKENESKCGCATWNSCRDNDCGVESYNSCRTKGCGVESYKSCAHSNCGVARYKSCRSSSCGSSSCVQWTCYSSTGGVLYTTDYKNGCTSGATSKCSKSEYPSCRTSSCGVESYNTCVDSACGVAQYKYCSHSECGVDKYKYCRTSDCGCEKAASCTKTENQYRYYTCETKSNIGTVGELNGNVCYY